MQIYYVYINIAFIVTRKIVRPYGILVDINLHACFLIIHINNNCLRI